VVFCTGGNGTICSAQVRALVHLGANACIVGRDLEKSERMARDIATAREGSKVLGLGAVDVRSSQSLQQAIDLCVEELGGIDFLMHVHSQISVLEFVPLMLAPELVRRVTSLRPSRSCPPTPSKVSWTLTY
jgi:NAD(P)-dependent dehydrogenase (short-subunit alcohol dehydrogenase family)